LSHKFEGEGQLLEIKYKKSIHKIKLNLIGKVQLKNMLMAIIASIKSNISIKDIFNVMPSIKPVNGRFEKIGKIKNNSKVILDYAHTPDALKTCLKNLKEQFSSHKVSLVFGCGGIEIRIKELKWVKLQTFILIKFILLMTIQD
jgi:murE/murF fusion protein